MTFRTSYFFVPSVLYVFILLVLPLFFLILALCLSLLVLLLVFSLRMLLASSFATSFPVLTRPRLPLLLLLLVLLLLLPSLRAHSVRGVAVSWAFARNASLSSILAAASWSSAYVVTSFYLSDVQFSSHDFSLGPLVVAGSVV